MTQPPLWGPGSRGGPVRATASPPARPQRIAWAEQVLKIPPPCSDCQIRLSREWGTGVPYVPASRARWKRTEGSDVTWFCSDHKNTRYTAETRAKASVR